MIIKEILSVLLILVNIRLPVKENLQKDFLEQLIENQGYSVKKYLIWTEDDYQISLHRIINPKPTKNSVLLQHGLLSCGAQWVVNKEKSLAFMLLHAGYDVWLLNTRGLSLSRGHRTLSADNPKYWDFSFDELGYYDVPAAIDNILKVTNRKALHFVGHSQGGNSILVTGITRPEYQSKIISAYLLHPAALIHNLYPLANQIIHGLTELLYERNMPALILRNTGFAFIFNLICSVPIIGKECTDFIMNVFGGNSNQAADPATTLDVYTKYVFNDASRKMCDHIKQLADARKFQMFDYGPEINKRTYNGSKTPPEYDVSVINFPISVEYGTIDGLTPARDVRTLTSRLKNVEKVIELPWNHLDLIHSKNANKWLHLPMIKSFNKYVNEV